MAFDKKVFADGESSYDVPYWRKAIEEIEANLDTFSYRKEAERQRRIQENEVGIKHPTNNSFIKIKDDGTIEAFAGESAGIRIKSDESLQVFGDIQLIGNKFQGITPVNEASFNDQQMTGDYPSLHEKGKSQGLKDLMKELEGGDSD